LDPRRSDFGGGNVTDMAEKENWKDVPVNSCGDTLAHCGLRDQEILQLNYLNEAI
jgi:hypothetical protein